MCVFVKNAKLGWVQGGGNDGALVMATVRWIGGNLEVSSDNEQSGLGMSRWMWARWFFCRVQDETCLAT